MANGKNISRSTEEMAKLYREGKTYQEIADQFGIIKQAVHGRFVRAGVKRRPPKHQKINKERLEKLYAEDLLPLEEIADRFGTHYDIIRAALKFHGIPKRPPLRNGGIYAATLRRLEIGQTTTIEISGKSPQATLHRSAAAIGIKISVRAVGKVDFKVVRLK